MTQHTIASTIHGNDEAAPAPHENLSVSISTIDEVMLTPADLPELIATMGKPSAPAGNLKYEADSLKQRYEELDARLSEVVYDPANGKPSPKITGDVRAALELQAKSLYNQAVYALAVYEAARRHEEAATSQRTAQQSADEVAFQYHNGDPAKKALFNDALERAKAARAADAYLSKLS